VIPDYNEPSKSISWDFKRILRLLKVEGCYREVSGSPMPTVEEGLVWGCNAHFEKKISLLLVSDMC